MPVYTPITEPDSWQTYCSISRVKLCQFQDASLAGRPQGIGDTLSVQKKVKDGKNCTCSAPLKSRLYAINLSLHIIAYICGDYPTLMIKLDIYLITLSRFTNNAASFIKWCVHKWTWTILTNKLMSLWVRVALPPPIMYA